VIPSFVADFGNLLWTLASFVIALGVIVAVHEYGHYIIGRLSGIKADVFSLGFGPVVASRVDRNGMRWQLAAIPLGGFVRFRGDKDAASALAGDDAHLTAAEARQTMTGAPLWARTATVAAGPIFNFILAFVIFWAMLMVSGLQTGRPVVGEVHAMPQEQGLMTGDEILAIDGQQTPDLQTLVAVANNLPPKAQVSYSVQRGDQVLDILASHPFPARASSVHLQSAAFSAGLQTGDVVLRLGGQPVYAFDQLRQAVTTSNGAPLDLVIWRAGAGEIPLQITPLRRDAPTADGGFETKWMIGVSSSLSFAPQMRSAGLLEAAQIAARQVWAVLDGTISGIAHMIRGEISTCNLAGPVGLAETMGEAASTGLESFVTMLAMVSLGVGLLNLMPVPMLDGGHLMFYAYEAISRRKPNPKVMNIAVMVGMFLVLSLMIFALGNDLTCV
jgi:regulator of sigma E protease